MADFWIKLEKNTPDKPEIFEMAEMLSIDPDAVLGKLIRVWCWVDSNSSDGHIKSVTPVLIDRLTMSQGFADAMTSVGWLEETSIPNFSRHLGESAKKRAKDSERKRKSRESSEECPEESVTKRGLDKSRVDKNRVEATNDEKNDNKSKDASLLIFADYGFSDQQISLIFENRKKNSKNAKSAKITEIIAKSICKEMKLCVEAGYTIDNVLNEWHETSWVAFKAEWIQKRIPLNNNAGNHNGQDQFKRNFKETPLERMARKQKSMDMRSAPPEYHGQIVGENDTVVSTQMGIDGRGSSQ